MRDDQRAPLQRKLTDEDRAKIRQQHKSWLGFIAIAAIDGVLIGIVVALSLIWFNINGIGELLARSSNQMGYTFMLLAGFGHTFGMVAAGMSIWIRATKEGKSDSE